MEELGIHIGIFSAISYFVFNCVFIILGTFDIIELLGFLLLKVHIRYVKT